MALCDRSGVLVPGSLCDIRWTVHRANLAIARSTPGEQPYVVGWDLLASSAGIVVVIDVNDDPDQFSTWMVLTSGTIVAASGAPLPEDADVRVVHLPLDETSIAGQQHRDGLTDRFHVTHDAALAFGEEARAWIGDGIFYCLDSAGVRTYSAENPLEEPLRQTLDDIAIGYGGPVGYSVTVADDGGWRRVTVGALGEVTWATWPTSVTTLG